ncbi:hypothetical protein ACH5RR_020443 [Cinchona calisaya]|uniref:Uncharacterized protein n=1 Tax=Cinchona calisaya TaxID=153742 RepID=A0ABD2ZFM5_9GENT
MTDEKKIRSNEYQKLLKDLKTEKILLPEKFAAGVLIEKLPDSWNDYKNNLKHKQKTFTFEKLVTNILIEDTNRKDSTKEMALKVNMVQSNNKRYKNKSKNYKSNNPNFKKKKVGGIGLWEEYGFGALLAVDLAFGRSSGDLSFASS